MATLDDRAQGLYLAAGVVSQLFCDAPSEALVGALATPGEWPIDDPDSARALEECRVGLAAAGDDLARALRTDQFELFVGPGRGFACPYESVWLSPENLMFDEQTYQVREEFARLGLEAPALEKEPDDHIGLEFAFVAEIAKCLPMAADEESLQALRGFLADFLDNHLGRYAPEVLALVEKHATTPVYRALPALARGVLAEARALAAGD